MKSVCLLLITAVCLSTMVLGCRKKNEDPVKISNNISKIADDFSTCEITYNKDEYPISIKYNHLNGNFSNSLEIIYKENKIEKLMVVWKDGTSTTNKNLTVSYPKENEVNILNNQDKTVLIFDKELLTEINTFNSEGKIDYMQKHFYNSESNLIRVEQYEGGAIRNKTLLLYHNYDTNRNPFFAKAKVWAIIAYNLEFSFTAMPMPISKNNPRILAMEYPNISSGEKIEYEYNANSFPNLLTYSYVRKNVQSPVEGRPLPGPGDYELSLYKTRVYY